MPAAPTTARPARHRPSIPQGSLSRLKMRRNRSRKRMAEMKRLKKSILLPLRTMAFRCNRLRLYYWADRQLAEMSKVVVMPQFYYRVLFRASMRCLQVRGLARLADRVIHTIPYHIRFIVA
jgi:hypothetical protein